MNKVLSIFIIVIFIMTSFNFCFAEENEIRPLSLQEQQSQVDERLNMANERLQYVESELSESVFQIQRLEDKLNDYNIKLNEINEVYSKIEKEVEEKEKELEKIKEIYKRKKEILDYRLVQLYKKGTINYIDVLIGSKDILEFISNLSIMKEIAKYDTIQLENVKKQKNKIQKISNENKEKKVKMKFLKIEAETQSTILTNTKIVLENHKENLDEKEKKILAEIESYKRQQKEIDALIKGTILNSQYELSYSGGIMMWPTYTTSYITSPFGSRMHPIRGIIKNHDGIDIGGKSGDPIYAAQDGLIIYSQERKTGYGNMIMIDHGLNEQGIKIVTLYGHGRKLLKMVGETVKKGDVIMEMGTTGDSTGNHLHFEVRENGVAVDPKKFLSA